LTTFTPALSWNYADPGGDNQAQRQIQVDTSENDNSMWDNTVSTSSQSAVYGGSALSRGVTYYWRVRVYDGYEWSSWLYGGTFRMAQESTISVAQDFTISVGPSSGSAVQGELVTATVSLTSVGGFSETVSLLASGLPSGATAGFSSSSGTPSFNSTLTISTSSTTPTGIYTITITGAGGGKTNTCTYTLTVSPRVVQETPPENIPRIEPGVPQTITVENMGITDLTINVGESAENVQISVQQLTDRPATIEIAAPGVVYQHFSITVENLPEDKIDNVVIHFKVEKSWIADNLVVINTIVLNRYDSATGQWVSLPTTYLGEDDTYVYFSAVSPGLSVFAVSGTAAVPDFGVSVDPTSGSVALGESTTATVSITQIEGLSSTVSLSASGLPSGATISFSQSSGTPSFDSTITISTASTTPAGTYTITITATDGVRTHTCVYILNVTAPTPVSRELVVLVVGIVIIAIIITPGLLGLPPFRKKKRKSRPRHQ
jgi:PGF-pre-PGF domain-containing protein